MAGDLLIRDSDLHYTTHPQRKTRARSKKDEIGVFWDVLCTSGLFIDTAVTHKTNYTWLRCAGRLFECSSHSTLQRSGHA